MYRQYAIGQYQQNKGDEASARIYEAIVALLQENLLPSTTAQRAKAIAQRGKIQYCSVKP